MLPDEWMYEDERRVNESVLGTAEKILCSCGEELQPEIFLLSGGIKMGWERHLGYMQLCLYENKWELWGEGEWFGDTGLEIRHDIGSLIQYLRVVFLHDATSLLLEKQVVQ